MADDFPDDADTPDAELRDEIGADPHDGGDETAEDAPDGSDEAGGAAFRQRREGTLGDDLTLVSPAINGWCVLDLNEPLAMSWMPAVGQRPRTAIDPVVTTALV
jgi:hypothetical protein